MENKLKETQRVSHQTKESVRIISSSPLQTKSSPVRDGATCYLTSGPDTPSEAALRGWGLRKVAPPPGPRPGL